jgi:hypothetical protein
VTGLPTKRVASTTAKRPQRGIRGQTTDDEREALHDEGIEVVPIPVPRALKGPVQ